MEYQTLDTLGQVAELYPDIPAENRMSNQERLQRWADLLSQAPARQLSTLEGTEYVSGSRQAEMRSDNSPISVAFADSLLRRDGLKSDTYGEAKRFFGLSDSELHHVVCYCHFGRSMTAGTAAGRVRSIISTAGQPLGRVTRAWQALIG
jgi:hypothetical protein